MNRSDCKYVISLIDRKITEMEGLKKIVLEQYHEPHHEKMQNIQVDKERLSPEQAYIINMLIKFLVTHPEQRFCQALTNLSINELQEGLPRDVYNDFDTAVMKRMANSIKTWENY